MASPTHYRSDAEVPSDARLMWVWTEKCFSSDLVGGKPGHYLEEIGQAATEDEILRLADKIRRQRA